MNVGGEKKAHLVLEQMGGLLSVDESNPPINQLFKSRLQALGV